MKRFILYKHVGCKDMAILPLRVFYIPEKLGYKVKVRYFTLGYKTPFDMNLTETIFITNKEYPNWLPLQV